MFKVEISKQATKFIQKQDNTTKKRIKNILLSLAENPFSYHGITKLTGYDNLYRARIGKYRIIYRIIDDKLILYIKDVDSRGDVYKRL